MPKIVQLKTEQEKNEMIIYLTTKILPEIFNKLKKRKFRRNSQIFTVKNGILYFKESDVEKIFVCDFETNKKNEIIKKYHEEDHASIKTTFSRVKAHTYGINYIDVVDFLKIV
ncbi:hypothetical protein DMUE_5948 [Dictyocoela muelleri]|nr:hypothetical protein DMUE_5948 [Dictyocoela muelleri]